MTGAYVWDGVHKAFHILIHDAFLLAVYSPPGRPLEKKGLGLVSVLPSVSVGWSPHLPHCQSTASSKVSVTVRVFIPKAPLNEIIVNGYRRYSQNSCLYLLPALTGVEPESSGEHVSPVTTTTSSLASLSELNVTVHVLFSASTRPTGQLEGRGAEVTWRVSDRSTSVGCWHCLHVLDPDRLSSARWVAV